VEYDRESEAVRTNTATPCHHCGFCKCNATIATAVIRENKEAQQKGTY